jgi:hypothetical protein
MKIGSLFRKETSALFLVEEDDGLRWKSFRTRHRDRCGSVGTAQPGRVPGCFDLRVRAAVEQNQEAETCSFENLPFSTPGICFRARRMI